MDESTIKDIKALLVEKTKDIQQDIDDTVSTLEPEELIVFENMLYGDYDYYEKKYSNEETVESNITKLFDCFPIEYIMSEVRDYMSKRVYMCALHEYIKEQDL